MIAIAALAVAIGLGALVFVLTRGSPESRSRAAIANAAEAPDTTPSPAAADAYTITTTNPEVKVALIGALPKSPGSSADADCNERFASPPKSPGAKIAAAKGWLIADEGRLGPLTAVAIASGFVSGTSSFCLADHGNVALFDGDRLVAILYTREGEDGDQIGGFEAVSGALRIATGGPVMPLGDLTLSGHAIRFGPFAALDAVCGGRRQVPSIYGRTIAVARRKLMAAGWKPVPAKDDPDAGEIGYFAADLRKAGIVEVEDCLPTGYGQCHFTYAAGRDTLGVGSIGDSPEKVASYSATCG
jgi:hypothetical protein